MGRERTTERALVVYGQHAVQGLLDSGQAVDRVHVLAGLRGTAIAATARARGVHAIETDRAGLDRLAGSSGHQGVVAIAPPYGYADLDTLADPACDSALVLDGIQDPRNLGAILRTARAVGVGGVVMPRDRSVAVTPVVAMASAGTLFGMRIARVTNLVRAMESLKEFGFWLVGLAADADQSVLELDPPPRPALVLGGEGEGLRPLVARHCDLRVGIPMTPGVESLNVAVATGVALYGVVWRARTRAR